MDKQSEEVIRGLADFFAKSYRTPVFRRPDEYGLEYEDVFFPSMDGVSLEGWFIPTDSDKLVICNHFMPGNRYGYPGHLEPWKNFGGFEVNFIPQYKALHDAGYNVLAYDLRNHGNSDDGNGRMVGIGLLEYRDVIGSLNYVNSRADTKNMIKGLISVCLGCNSTLVAMNKHPEYFKDIKSLLALQPVSARPFIERACEEAKIDLKEGTDLFDLEIQKRTGFHMDELSPIEHAKAVTVPTLMVQVHHDTLTRPSDVQTIFDNLSSEEKELFWIEGTTRRFDGYNYFSENPATMLEWLGKYTK